MADVNKPVEKKFHPYDAREVEKPLSNCDALLSLVKCVVGSGCLALPLAFYRVGYIGGILMTIFMTAVLIFGLQLLVRCMVESSRQNMVGYMNFPETMTYAISVGPKCCQCLSKCAGHFVNGILIFFHYGVCVVYIVFVSINVKQVVDYNCHERINTRLYCFIVGTLSLPLFSLRHLKYLVPTNILANLLMYTGLACIFYYLFTNLPPIDEIRRFNSQLSLFVGIIMFGTSSVGVMLAIEAKMATPGSYVGWLGVLNRCALFVAVTYILIGFMGYWRYGDYVAASVTLNIPIDEACIDMCLLYRSSYGPGRWKLVRDLLMLLLGLVILGYGTYSAVIDMIREYSYRAHEVKAGSSTEIKTPEEINAAQDAATLDYPIVDDVTAAGKSVKDFYL
ncbi:glutamate transporter polyphemus isoform X2 [Drosophila mojavensis]|uniref:Uncharacterized protein, isoform B n=1 Tax=Drosophila mojavensis TaxID=7230 RepID=A0A0Q9XDP9_DROMO|nr:glutamate transporter polyphemus isoform X2 [Drosophila mojavensis]KRG06703.1 uncharacterized protein Dmoj_GI11441, isoform B [Drosophila mojavensis]